MFQTELKLRVRYAETDQMGFVYYGNYATYFEVARVEALAQCGMRYRDLEAQGILMPVLENYSKYLRPAKYDDLLTIKVALRELPRVKIRFDYQIFNAEKQLLHEGYTVLCFLEARTQRPQKAPKDLLEALIPHFEK
jgi:acyl-CoA thioester hydrolase